MIRAARGTLATSAMIWGLSPVGSGRGPCSGVSCSWVPRLVAFEVMSYRGRVSPLRPQTRRARDHTAVRGRNCVGHRASPWAPVSSAPEEGEKTCPLQTISRSVEEFGERIVCSAGGVSRRGALRAPDGGSQRSRCREPPSVVSATGTCLLGAPTTQRPPAVSC